MLVLLTAVGVPAGWAAEVPAGADAGAMGRTPPRLSFIDGQVSFWRAGAEEWVAARLNTPLAPGDELYTGFPGDLEVQIGARAYVRAWANTRVGLASLAADFVQLKAATGHLALDVRGLDPGYTIEVDTPNAAFTIDHAGYYRVNVTQGRTSFITRRSGRATVTPANGTTAAVAPSEEVIVEGTDSPQVATSVAPELDAWDRWNYARTDALIESVSARYVSAGIYGVDDLDDHGSWRIVDTYGPVWVPAGVPVGWVPYSTGTWMWDPYYSWTWVDTAPWGWAPYHYGRWLFVSGFWAWAPGPVVLRPAYAPALVVFFGPRVGMSVGVVGPTVGWVALGWGEPLVPWWGPVGFIGVPGWAGWGGPRIVNNVVISRTTVVHVREINVYQNVRMRNAVTVIARDRFGHGPVTSARIAVDPKHLEPVRGKLEIVPVRASLGRNAPRGARTPAAAVRRPVVATGEPEDPGRWRKPQGIAEPSQVPEAPPPLVPPASHPNGPEIPPPGFGASTIERPRPPLPRRPERAQPLSGEPPTLGVPQQPPAAPRPGTLAPVTRPTPPTTGVEPRRAPTAPRAEPRLGVPAPPARRESLPPSVQSRPAGPEARRERRPAPEPTRAEGRLAVPAPSRAQAPSPRPRGIREAPRPEVRADSEPGGRAIGRSAPELGHQGLPTPFTPWPKAR